MIGQVFDFASVKSPANIYFRRVSEGGALTVGVEHIFERPTRIGDVAIEDERETVVAGDPDPVRHSRQSPNILVLTNINGPSPKGERRRLCTQRTRLTRVRCSGLSR